MKQFFSFFILNIKIVLKCSSLVKNIFVMKNDYHLSIHKMLYIRETLILSSNMRGYLNLQVPMGI